jgi:hypothetical protein
MINEGWNDELSDNKLTETTTTFAASLISPSIRKEDREKLISLLFLIGDYEMEFIYSYTMHLVDMLAEIDKNTSEDDHTELEIQDLMDYTLQHMGIDGRID